MSVRLKLQIGAYQKGNDVKQPMSQTSVYNLQKARPYTKSVAETLPDTTIANAERSSKNA